MNAALWGFLGTIVGALATFGATAWQQHVSHARERERRRRDSQTAVLSDLREAVADLARCQDTAFADRQKAGRHPPYRGDHRQDIAEAHFRVLMLASTVLDEGLREETKRLCRRYSDVENAGDIEEVARLHGEVAQSSGDLVGRIGEQLRALY